MLGLLGAVTAAVAVDFGGREHADAAVATWQPPPPYAGILGVV